MTLTALWGLARGSFDVGAVLAAAGIIALVGPARADTPSSETLSRAAAALYEGIRTETLPNGLKVYLKPIPGSPVVTTMVAYKVGSADEDLDTTGLSHYLEHLMFKGTESLMPGDIDRVTLRNGGSNNAYTSEDYTIYHFDFAADRWEAALEIEADRMRNLRIDAKHEFEGEKEVVVSELERNEDEPWDLEQKMILPMLFGKTSPYGHPVIGERAHVRGATAAIIKAHYDKWYHPNNAALVVCGGFDADQALAKIKKLFGPIPAKDLPERKSTDSVERKAPVRDEIASKFDVPRLLMGFNSVKMGDPDYYALDVLQAVLSNGKTSRLYRKLIEGKEVASSVGAINSAGRYPGWFSIAVELVKDKDRKEVESLVLEELKRVRDEPVSQEELNRVQRKLLVSAIFQRESVHNLADTIARGVTTNNLDFLKQYLTRIAAVTPKELQEAARKYLDPQKSVVIWSVPDKKRGDAGTRRRSNLALKRGSADPATGAGSFSLKGTERVELPNGLVLLLRENRRLPIVVAEALVSNTRLLEPEDKTGLANLVGRLLDEGTLSRNGQAIAELIENAGGSLDMSSNGGTVRVLSSDRSLGLRLFFECLIQPNFPQASFTRERQSLLSEIDDAESQPEVRAQNAYREIAYGKHPYGRPGLGRRKTVEGLTRENCQELHRQLFVPNNTVVAIVGDFDSKQIVEEVKVLTAEWTRAVLPPIDTPKVEKPGKFTEKILSLPQAAQLHFYMGHAGIARSNPDYYKLQVMDYVLGTGPGFTDRLSARLRDRQGLAYTVSANITASAADEPGLFTCYIGTAPPNFAAVKKVFLEELNRIRSEKPTATEVEDAKKYLLGSLPFRFTTNERIAGQLLAIEHYHLGFDYVEQYRAAIAAVKPEDVQAVAKQYLDPERMVLVAAGAVDAKGEPIKKLPPPKEKSK